MKKLLLIIFLVASPLMGQETTQETAIEEKGTETIGHAITTSLLGVGYAGGKHAGLMLKFR